MNSSNVPFGDGPEQKQRWSTFWTTGLCSTKSCPCHDTFLSHIPWCRKAFTVSKKTNAFFFFFYIQRLKVEKVSPGNHTHIVIRACSLLMLLLKSGGAISNLLLMLRPCFTWLLSSQPPLHHHHHHQTELTTETDGCWHQVAPMGGETDSYHDNLRIGNHLTCRAAGDSRGASVSRWIPPLTQLFFYFAASVDKSVRDLWWAAGRHHHYLRVHLFQASCKGINDSL